MVRKDFLPGEKGTGAGAQWQLQASTSRFLYAFVLL